VNYTPIHAMKYTIGGLMGSSGVGRKWVVG
jgi:hypothetical protein